MAMNYAELDDKTRESMLLEFEAEHKAGNPYRSKALSSVGLQRFPDLMREAIQKGNEVSLARALDNSSYWTPTETYVREGVTRERNRNLQQSAERLAITEFSTWYVRGFAKRLLNEGVEKCQIYRGAQPKWEPGECAGHEGQIVDVKSIYDNHRSRYWPEPGNSLALSIPFGPGCHHLIRRVGI